MAYRNVILRGRENTIKESSKANASGIVPGNILERAAGGTVQNHSAEGGDPGVLLVALRRTWYDDGSGDNSIDQAYTSGDDVTLCACPPGTRFAGRLKAGESVAENDLLESGGDGTLVAAASPPGTDIVRALETVNNSAGLTPARIKVEAVY